MSESDSRPTDAAPPAYEITMGMVLAHAEWRRTRWTEPKAGARIVVPRGARVVLAAGLAWSAIQIRGADLSDAVLRGADLSRAVLSGAVLSGHTMPQNTVAARIESIVYAAWRIGPLLIYGCETHEIATWPLDEAAARHPGENRAHAEVRAIVERLRQEGPK